MATKPLLLNRGNVLNIIDYKFCAILIFFGIFLKRNGFFIHSLFLCLLGPKNFWIQKYLGKKSLVKMRSVTAEIMLIWTNVARTYVVLKSVAITVGIC